MQAIRHLLLPHHTNNHRARLLHPTLLAFFIALLLLLHAIFNFVASVRPGVLGIGGSISVTELINLTNQKRQEQGASPVVYDGQLDEAAYKKAQDMFANNYWAHTSPSGKEPWVFMTEAGYNYHYAGENLAKDFSTSQAVIDAWMASPSHRENLLRGEYQHVGMAVVTGTLDGKETVLIVQMFGSRMLQPLAQAPETQKVVPVVSPKPVALQSELIVERPNQPKMSEQPPVPAENVLSETPTVFLSSAKETSRPHLDIFAFTKATTLMLSLVLILVLGLDTYVAYHNNVIRLSGNNWAHIAYILVLASAIWLTSSGAIL